MEKKLKKILETLEKNWPEDTPLMLLAKTGKEEMSAIFNGDDDEIISLLYGYMLEGPTPTIIFKQMIEDVEKEYVERNEKIEEED
jgi:hypothetical protein